LKIHSFFILSIGLIYDIALNGPFYNFLQYLPPSIHQLPRHFLDNIGRKEIFSLDFVYVYVLNGECHRSI